MTSGIPSSVLVFDLACSESAEDDLSAMSESLKPAFARSSKRCKEDIVQAILPALRQVRDVHDQLATKTDRTFAAAIIGFDDVCKQFEALEAQDGEISKTFVESKVQSILSLD
jgi:hypothetical protein